MKKSLFFILVAPLLWSCNEDQNADFPKNSSELVKFDFEREEIEVGVKNSIRITASMTKDAEGETCTFTASAGGFSTYDEKLKTQDVTVDLQGQATVLWFAPNDPGEATISALIKTVNIDSVIQVLPVSEIIFNNDFIEAYGVDSTFVLSITVDDVWKGLPIEISTSEGILEVLGPSSNEISKGSKVLPVLDQTGRVQMKYATPSEAKTIILTASLFGTVVNQSIIVDTN